MTPKAKDISGKIHVYMYKPILASDCNRNAAAASFRVGSEAIGGVNQSGD